MLDPDQRYADPAWVMEQFLEHLPNPVQVFDAEGFLVQSNSACLRVFGLPPIPGYNLLHDPAQHARGHVQRLQRALAGEVVKIGPFWYSPGFLEQQALFKDRPLAITLMLFPLRDREGVVRYVVSMAEDRTAELLLVEKEAALEKARHEAEETAAREQSLRRELELILSAMNEGIVLVDPEGHVRLMNRAARETMGEGPFTLVELLRRSRSRSTTTGDEMTLENAPLARALRGERPEPQLLTIPAHGLDGVEHIFSVSAAPLLDEAGHILGALAVTLDVTSSLFSDQLHRRMTSLFRHDLRTPLSVIRLAADALQRLKLNHEQQRFAKLIQEGVERCSQLNEDLLDLLQVRPPEGLPRRLQMADFTGLVERVVAGLRLMHPSCELLLESGGPVAGRWEVERIRQVTSNLVKNALLYGLEGHPVRVRIQANEQQVSLTVSNRAEDVDEELLRRRLRSFSPRPDRKVGEGYGLGLYIVQQVMRAVEGQLSLQVQEDLVILEAHFPRR
ncbi:MAG: PAS domain-containing protein [Myxococcota bacterium]